ncbi:hypothetical protein BJI48_04500 [Helicobacter sp. 11S02596-1]|nr:hypothetical protein BJI48_04500 [Helicobacter sp. 11S02596-1]
MQFKDTIDSFEQITPENFDKFLSTFGDYKDIESTFYYEITAGRIKIIEALKDRVKNNELERMLQEHIFENLWLLDPSWERATEPISFEQTVKIEFDKIEEGEKPDVRKGRMDLKYRKTSGKHVIIELKRASVKVKIAEIIDQVGFYIKAVKKQLSLEGKGYEPVEAICIVGVMPAEWDNLETREEDIRILEIKKIRVMTYQQLINQAYSLYSDYLNRQTDKGKLLQLLQEIENLR